jgi:hypothetical protein
LKHIHQYLSYDMQLAYHLRTSDCYTWWPHPTPSNGSYNTNSVLHEVYTYKYTWRNKQVYNTCNIYTTVFRVKRLNDRTRKAVVIEITSN